MGGIYCNSEDIPQYLQVGNVSSPLTTIIALYLSLEGFTLNAITMCFRCPSYTLGMEVKAILWGTYKITELCNDILLFETMNSVIRITSLGKALIHRHVLTLTKYALGFL
jgi:hypothetical protein